MPAPRPAKDIPLDDETIAKLRNISTATIATLLFKKGYTNAYIQGVAPLQKGSHMVGPAYTLRYIPARKDTDPIEAFLESDHPQRLAIDECPKNHVLIMDCRQDASAASAGSILLTRLAVRGAAGVVTDGGIRDSAAAAKLELPVFAAKPSAPTNLTKHHALEINVPIGCGTVAVYPGDIAVGDDDGVMIIPRHLAAEIANKAIEMERFEAFVLERVKKGAAVIGLYPPTDDNILKEYEAAREKTGD